jgi:uncharacterized protein (DUF1800 family)
MTRPDPATAAALAAHRFGLGERDLRTVGRDPHGWLLSQLGPAEPQRGEGLVGGAAGIRRHEEFQREQRRLRAAPPAAGATAGTATDVATPAATATANPAAAVVGPAATRNAEALFAEHFRPITQADVRARLATAATTLRPFNERLALFWANHFTVSMAKASARGLVGAFEREAIRPHTGGGFGAMLGAAVRHAGMLRYLDNDQSAGPLSRLAQRLAQRPRAEGAPAPRVGGLNENLAREVLELHTLGAAGGGGAYGGWGGYTQSDVTEFARVLTGWRVPVVRLLAEGPAVAADPTRFDPAWHDPGPKTVLDRRYPEGPDALDAVLADLARHPSTARFVSFKLARHFVADEPPPALVARLAAAFSDSDGDLPSLARALVDAPEAWAGAPAKLKSPEEFVVSTARLLGLGEQAFARAPDGGVGTLGQRVQAAPSPAGWPDRAEEWLGPDAVWKRVEWATRIAERMGRQLDARALAEASLGPLLGARTRIEVERAADGPQALALLLLAPEFQRR